MKEEAKNHPRQAREAQPKQEAAGATGAGGEEEEEETSTVTGEAEKMKKCERGDPWPKAWLHGGHVSCSLRALPGAAAQAWTGWVGGAGGGMSPRCSGHRGRPRNTGPRNTVTADDCVHTFSGSLGRYLSVLNGSQWLGQERVTASPLSWSRQPGQRRQSAADQQGT